MYTVTHRLKKTDVVHMITTIFNRRVLLGFVSVDYFDVIWCEKFADAQYIAECIKSTGINAKVNQID